MQIDLGSIGFVFRGEWEAGMICFPNDVVLLQNSCWICLAETQAAPGAFDSPWQMMVSGVEGPVGPKGEKGEAGEPRELSDSVTSSNSTVAASSKAVKTAYDKAVEAAGMSGSHSHGAADITSGTLAVARGGTGQTSVQALRNSMGLGNTTGVLPTANGGTGNANGTVAQLTTARNFSVTGGATAAAVSFNGTGNVALNVTALDVSKATAGTLPIARGGTGNTTGTSATASKLATARTIAISGAVTGTATSFDGSGNVSIPATALDISKANAGTLPVARGGTGVTSIAALITALGFTQSKSAPGWCKLPSGIIIQWAITTAARGDTVTFPLAFPSAICVIMICDINSSYEAITPTIYGSSNRSLTGFRVMANNSNSGGFNWIAIGH